MSILEKLYSPRLLASLLALVLLAEPARATTQHPFNMGQLQKDQFVNGFRTIAIYLNDVDNALGARFKHERTGFTVDLVQIESVPQSFIWVNTILNTDSGVAHTQEHLLLGKGNKGRIQGSRNEMSLVSHSAGTDQWRTYYHYNTLAGKKAFFKTTKEFLDLLLHPDYTDEEIRREVRNFQVKQDDKDKKLILAEGGTVYNEMISYEYGAQNVIWFAAMKMVFGQDHPLSCRNGGSPEGIRKLEPSEIRQFHAKNYVLHNMGMILSLPKSIAVDEMLAELNQSLDQLQKQPSFFSTLTNNDFPAFPAPKPQSPGSIKFVSFADSNNKKPGSVEFIWPAQLDLDVKERLLIQYFLSGLAGDADTPLYKLFVNSKTLKVDSGATGVGGYSFEVPGNPAFIYLADVDQSHINIKDITKFRDLVLAEISKIAQWKDGSSELKEFNARVLGTLRQDKRYYGDFINRPPSFGERHTSSTMMKQFIRLEHKGGFRRHLTLSPDLAALEKELSSNKNVWRYYIAKWKLLTTKPFSLASKPDPSLLKKQDEEKQVRLNVETERLKKIFKVNDAQEALRLYKEEYEKNTAELEAVAKQAGDLKPTDSLPMTMDDHLDYKVNELPGGVQLLTAMFESMRSSNTNLALRLDGVPEEDLLYLSLFPELLTQCGIIENGKPITYEETLKRLRSEIYYLNSYFANNSRTPRYELKLNASGSNVEESKRAIEWMKSFLLHPYWRVENLPRIRDLVEQSLSGLRGTRDADYEESWDSSFAGAYCWQHRPLYNNIRSFLTKTHNAQRLRWLLRGDKDPETLKSFKDFMNTLGQSCSKLKRELLQNILLRFEKQTASAPPPGSSLELSALFERYKNLSKEAKLLVADAASDLIADLPDIPDDSLELDWKDICNEIAEDSQVSPAQTLARLDSIRESLLRRGAARMVFVGSQQSREQLKDSVESVITILRDEPFKPAVYSSENLIFTRLAQRMKLNGDPVFVGLVNPKSHYGLVSNKVPAIKYADLDDKSLASALAIGLYGGGGAESLFMKTWGAGLAYGNGPSWSPDNYNSYRADKMPSIPETLRFVAEQISKAKKDPQLVAYAIVGSFSSRAGADFESRAEALSDDLADNIGPEVVRKFREALLNLGKKKEITDMVYEQVLPQYGKIIPGLGLKLKDVAGGKYLAIGDEKQLGQYEDYLKQTEGQDAKLVRLWGRDFWIMRSTSTQKGDAAHAPN